MRSGDKWGFINASGRLVIYPQFKAAYYFQQGVAVAEVDSGEVLIDTSGKVVAQDFHVVNAITEGRVPISRGKKSGYLDAKGKMVIPLVYDGVMSFSNGLAAVQ